MTPPMRHWLPAAAAAAIVAACATAPEPEGAYRALGTEPFWSVTIADGRMQYDSPDGPPFSVTAPAPRPTFNGRRYETDRLTVDVSRAECSDGMSDRRYADTVVVIADGRTLHGCGGEILPPATLAGTNWAIVAIDGEAVEGERYFLQFEDDRLSGQAGCNRFSGPYSVSGEMLTPGPVAATRMACPGPAMEHERRALGVLGGPVQISHPDGDTMELTGSDGFLTLRRSI